MQVINSTWKTTAKAKTTSKNGYHKAREWQGRAYKLLKDQRFSILNAPMGSGKTWEMCLLSAHKMELDGRLRTIISVPQTIIGNGFLDCHIILPDTKKKIHWKPTHNLCDSSATSNVEYVIAFLAKKATPKTDLNDRVLVCTHATMVGVYKALLATGRLKLLDDLMLWIDEAHHVKNSEIATLEDTTISNGIGSLAKHIMGKKRNVHLGLATASFFRGDQCTLLTDDMMRKFTRFDLPYDEYLASMSHLKGFSFSFLLSGTDYMPSIGRLMKKRKKDIIYFPHPISKHARGDKLQDVADHQQLAKKLYGKKTVETEDGLTILSKGSSQYKILDLVNIENRDAKKDFTQTINDDRDALDAITAIGMFKEGANWVHADRSIIVGYRDSLVDIIQMIGRLFRDTPGKEHVEIINILPWTLDQTDRVAFREKLNNYLKGVYLLMVLEDVLTPMDSPAPAKKGPSGSNGNDPRRLTKIIKDPEVARQLLEDGQQVMLQLSDESNNTATREDYIQVVKKLVERKKIVPKAQAEHVATLVVRRFVGQGLKASGINVKDVDIDLLTDVNPVRWIVNFTNKHAGISTFRELRRALSESGKVFPSKEKTAELFDKFAKKSGLPRTVKVYQQWARGEFPQYA